MSFEEPASATNAVKSEKDVSESEMREKKAEKKMEDEPFDEGETNDDKMSDGAEEEEALFVKLEEDEERQESKQLHDQPKDVNAAPKLLQSALEQGQIKPDDSESEDEKKKTETAAPPEHHHHARVRKFIHTFFIFLFLRMYSFATF
jgi:hypothetical protein